MNPVRLWVCENAVLAGGGEPSIVPLSVDRTAQFTKSCLDGRQLRLDARLVQLVHEGRAGVRRRRETEKNMSRRRRRARKAKRHPNPTMTFANRTLSWRRQGQSPREIKTTRAFGCEGRGSPWQSDDRTEAESAGGGKRRQRSRVRKNGLAGPCEDQAKRDRCTGYRQGSLHDCAVGTAQLASTCELER